MGSGQLRHLSFANGNLDGFSNGKTAALIIEVLCFTSKGANSCQKKKPITAFDLHVIGSASVD